MQTILGPFAPHLENAFVDEVRADKKNRPFGALLVLVPSAALRQHLKIVLGQERKLSLLNVHLLTFHQLALRLLVEAGAAPPELRDDLFFEEVLRQLVRARGPGAEAFAGIEERSGGSAALWQTLRDLRDGMVDPEVALEAALAGPLARSDNERIRQLLLLFQGLGDFCGERGIIEASDLVKRATDRVPASFLLKRFERVFYYGFYDLTQIQLDFFHAVAQTCATTLFFPLLPAQPRHDAWSFAQRFYERHLQGYNTAPTRALIDPSRGESPSTFALFDEHQQRRYASPPGPWRCTIVNAFGVHDEVAVAAKEILRLIEDEQLAFGEIGVVARTLDAYGAAIREVFEDHRIPLNGDIETPLIQFPLAKAVILLLNLPAKDFLRPQVIDLLSSPYFKSAGLGENNLPARVDLWDLVTRELAICKGVSQWRRLRDYAHRDLLIRQPSHDEETRFIKIAAEHIRSLADIVEALAGELLALPQNSSWSGHAELWKRLLARYLELPGDDGTDSTRLETPHGKIFALLEQIAALDSVNDQVSSNEFTRTFQHWLERSSVAAGAEAAGGVRVLTATAARGLSFRALFILGLNEGVFPRTIREDAFLRDRDREILERDLGYKVNPKLAAFDEEKLIFTLLVAAARERLYCSYQRADETGRVLAPSWYLAELRRVLGSRRLIEVTIPRSPRDKAGVSPFDREELLLPEELAIRLSLDARDPGSLIASFAWSPEIYRHGRSVVAELDQSAGQLSGFDGIVGSIPAYWQYFSKRVSPSALESYARCPFQFFARHVLGLERLDRPEDVAGPSPADYGELGHAILNGFYRALIDNEYFQGRPVATDLSHTLRVIAERVCREHEAENAVGYPLTWEFLKEDLTRLIESTVARDLQEIAASGFVPVALEAEMIDRLPADWPEPLGGLIMRGRMDRIDRDPNSDRLRVIDYKFKLGFEPSTQDKNLERAALRGQRLQPPLYGLLGERWGKTHALNTAGVETRFYYIAPHWPEGPLVTAAFDDPSLSGKLGAEIKKTIAALVEGIRQGRFYIQRGPHCDYCEIAEICRRNHPPSLWRAESDPVTRIHREILSKDPKDL